MKSQITQTPSLLGYKKAHVLNLRASWYLSSLIMILCICVSACDDDGEEDNKPTLRGGEMAGETAGGDLAGNPAGISAGDNAGDNVGGTAGDSAGDLAGESAGDMSSLIRTIDNCEQLCDVYETCSASESHPWGDCMEGCMREDWEDQRFRSYVSCLKVEACESIDACRIPPAPLPTCEEACTTLELCELDYQLPMSLTQMGSCTSSCADETWARQISMCVQSNDRRLCDDPSFFDECILELRGGDCRPRPQPPSGVTTPSCGAGAL